MCMNIASFAEYIWEIHNICDIPLCFFMYQIVFIAM